MVVVSEDGQSPDCPESEEHPSEPSRQQPVRERDCHHGRHDVEITIADFFPDAGHIAGDHAGYPEPFVEIRTPHVVVGHNQQKSAPETEWPERHEYLDRGQSPAEVRVVEEAASNPVYEQRDRIQEGQDDEHPDLVPHLLVASFENLEVSRRNVLDLPNLVTDSLEALLNRKETKVGKSECGHQTLHVVLS